MSQQGDGTIIFKELTNYRRVLHEDRDAVPARYFQGAIDEMTRLKQVIRSLTDALEIVRDADDDCKKDGLQSMPPAPRHRIDKAIALGKGER